MNRSSIAQVMDDGVFFGAVPRDSASIEVVHIGRKQWPPGYRLCRSSSRCYVLTVVISGCGSYTSGKRTWELEPGSVFGFAHEVPHDIRSDPQNPIEVCSVAFNGVPARQMILDVTGDLCFCVRPTNAHTLLGLFRIMREAARERQPLAREVCRACIPVLYEVLHCGLVRESPVDDPSAAIYQRSRRFIEENYASIRSIEEVASTCHVSTPHLTRLFRKKADTTPYAFLVGLKMGFAAHLLTTTNLPLKTIASQLAYSDEFVFSRAFKRVCGVAPRMLRQQ